MATGRRRVLFTGSFTRLSRSAPGGTAGRGMTFAYLPANIGVVVGPAMGSVRAAVDVFLVFPTAAVLTALGLVAVILAWRQPVAAG